MTIISEEGKSKSRTFVVSSIIKKLDKMNLNGEHSQQRDFVWEKNKQYNLISDVLQNNPLPELVFAEQIINNAAIIWVIDGKQRCTTLKKYVENKFAIGANVTRYMISYSEPVKDEDDCVVRDDNGDVVYCPCRLTKSEDTKCPCKEFREQTEPGECHCGLFVKE